jgi:hypothetical protein
LAGFFGQTEPKDLQLSLRSPDFAQNPTFALSVYVDTAYVCDTLRVRKAAKGKIRPTEEGSMVNYDRPAKGVGEHIVGALISLPIGCVGGAVCGAAILSLCGLAGRSQTSGAEYLGYWSIGEAMVGAMYGGPLGLILGPVGYLTVVRSVGFRSAILPAVVGTILGGFAGSLFTPGFGVPAGIIGFFLGLIAAKVIRSNGSRAADTVSH